MYQNVSIRFLIMKPPWCSHRTFALNLVSNTGAQKPKLDFANLKSNTSFKVNLLFLSFGLLLIAFACLRLASLSFACQSLPTLGRNKSTPTKIERDRFSLVFSVDHWKRCPTVQESTLWGEIEDALSPTSLSV